MKDQLIDYIKQHPKLIAAQDFEVNCQKTKIQTTRFLNGAELFKNEEHAWWICLKVLHRNKPGIACTVVPSEESLNRLIDQALISAEESHPDPWFRFPLWSTKNEGLKSEPEAPSSDFWKSLFFEMGQVEVPFQESYEWWEIEGSVFRRSEKTTKTFEHKLPRQVLTLGKHQEVFWGEQEKTRVQRALSLKDLQALEKAPSIKTLAGDTVISLSPRAMAPLIEHVAQWFFPKPLREGKSPFSGEDKEVMVLSSCLSLIDDGLNQATPWCAPFDLEGVSTQQTQLLEGGRFKGVLYDSYQGAIDNKRSTGNSLRNFNEIEPRLGFRHMVLEEGTESEHQVWAQEKRGYCFETWSRITFASSSEITGTLWGWEVCDGIKVRPIRLEGIQWDLVELLSKATRVCSDLKRYNFVSTPTTFFKGIS